MKVLITGMTGFIGKNLTNQMLKSDEYEIIGMTRNKNKAKQFEEKNVEIRYANLLKSESLRRITKDADVVIHLAALMRFHEKWEKLYKHNVEGTKIIAEDAIKQGVKHFIYISSTEATGPVKHDLGDETASYTPTYDYGKTKQISETWLNKKYKENGFPVTILRPTGVYGPGDIYVSLSTVRAIAQRKLKMLPGKGEKLVHFTYVDDITQGFLKTINLPEKTIGETIIIASNDYHTYKEKLTTIANILGVPPPKRSIPISLAKTYIKYVEMKNKRKGIDDFVMHASIIEDMKTNRAYSNKKAKKILGFQPKYDYNKGMRKTIEWYKEKNILN